MDLASHIICPVVVTLGRQESPQGAYLQGHGRQCEHFKLPPARRESENTAGICVHLHGVTCIYYFSPDI